MYVLHRDSIKKKINVFRYRKALYLRELAANYYVDLTL